MDKKGGSSHSQWLYIHFFFFFFGWIYHICTALHAMHTHLASGKRAREMEDKNPHHRWAYLANTKCTLTEPHLMIFELFIYLLDHIPHSFSTGCERPTKLPRMKSGRCCVCVDSNFRLIWRDTPLGLISITHSSCAVEMKKQQWWHHTTSQSPLLASSLFPELTK